MSSTKFLDNSRPVFVSIIISTFNDAEPLRRTLNSLAAGGVISSEILIIDGGSIDGTDHVISEFSHIVSHYISEPDCGIYDAWNKGLCLSKGSYIAFLGAGDYYIDDGLQRLIDFSLAKKDADLILSNINLVQKERFVRQLGSDWSWKIFRRYMNIAHVGAFHSRRLFNRYGMFDASYRIAGDYEFLLRSRDSLKTAYLDRVTVQMEAGGVSQTNPLVFIEAECAKIKHKAVHPLLARLDTYLSRIKSHIKRILFF